MKLKTRTNQPVYYKLPVSSNIQSLSDNLLNSLRVGDVVQKKTGNQKHCYIVTYKEEKKGICLSYFDGSGYMETISYDYTGGHWVYNSKDVYDGHNVTGDVSFENEVLFKSETTFAENVEFSNDVDIGGDLSVSGDITGDRIVQNMSGYYFTRSSTSETEAVIEYTYASACINGNKLTLVISGYLTKVGTPSSINLGFFEIPQALFAQLVPNVIGGSVDSALDFGVIQFASNYNSRIAIPYLMLKNTGNGKIQSQIYNTSSLVTDTKYSFRLEHTFLFSENLAPQE